jgi:hypothetical protein
MISHSVWVILRLVGKTAPHMIRSDYPVSIAEQEDEVPIEKGPGRVAMKHDDHPAVSFIDIGKLIAVYLKFMSSEWI